MAEPVPLHWSDDPPAVADLAQRARLAVAARVGLEDAVTRADTLKAFRDAGRPPHIPAIGRARAAVDALGIRHPRLAADLRQLIERLYVLDLLAQG